MEEFLDTAVGVVESNLTWWQMSLRAVGVFFTALLIIRIGTPRIFGKQTTMDIVLGIIYGSTLSRIITGDAPFWPTTAAALTLVLLHKALAAIAYHTNVGIGDIIKGRPQVLVKDGELQREVMRSTSVTRHDLEEAMRTTGMEPDISRIQKASLERSGDISIIQKPGE